MRTALTRSSNLPLWLALVLSGQLMLASAVLVQETKGKFQGDSNADPPVTQDDVRIVQRAKAILSSPAKWNRADNRECPKTAKTFSLYCALEIATDEVYSRLFGLDEDADPSLLFDERIAHLLATTEARLPNGGHSAVGLLSRSNFSHTFRQAYG